MSVMETSTQFPPFLQEQKLAHPFWNRHVPFTELETIVAATHYDEAEHQKLEKEREIEREPLVKIFRGAKGAFDSRNADRLNKDLIVQFVFSIPSEAFKQRVPKIFIDENVFVRGNRKKDQPVERTCDLKLFGTVENVNGFNVPLCNSCKKRGENQNLKIRTADVETLRGSSGFLEVIVKGSVTCSGNPPNCNNLLRVKFWMTIIPKGEMKEEILFWAGDTSTFGVLHHRRKEDGVEKSSSMMKTGEEMEVIVPVPKTITPSMSVSPLCEHGCLCHAPTTSEILGISMDLVLNDSTQELFDLHSLHVAILHSEMFVKEYGHLFPPKVHPQLVSLLLGLTAIRDSMFDFDFLYGKSGSHFLAKKLEFYYPHCLKALATIEAQNNCPPPKQITQLIWKHACQLSNPAARVCNFYCCCKGCILSHLAFIIHAALHRGASLDDVARCFNESAPASILKDLLEFKGKHFNMSIYVSDTPIGRFSRAFYPPSVAKQAWLSINSSGEEIIKTQPHLVNMMQLIYPLEVYPLIYQFIHTVGVTIGSAQL